MSFGEIEFPRVCHSGSDVGKRDWYIYILHDNHASVCVCVPRGTQKLMLISVSLRPCVQHTTPVLSHPPQPRRRASQTTRVTVMRFLRTQMVQNMQRQLNRSVARQKTRTVVAQALRWNETCTLRAIMLATHRRRSVEFTSPARRKRNLWCSRRWGWGIGCSWKWHCAFSEILKDFVPR